MTRPDICPGCDREAGSDEGYGLDPDCGECFEEPDGAPQTREESTAGWSPEPAWADWRDKHSKDL